MLLGNKIKELRDKDRRQDLETKQGKTRVDHQETQKSA